MVRNGITMVRGGGILVLNGTDMVREGKIMVQSDRYDRFMVRSDCASFFFLNAGEIGP